MVRAPATLPGCARFPGDQKEEISMFQSQRARACLAGAVLAAVGAVVVPMMVSAQAPEGPPAYRPGLGDLMTTTVQPRHAKLALAGRQKNWVYAAYEVHELDEAFDRLSVQWPNWQRVRIVELVETIIRQPLYDLTQAVKDKNESKYATAYAQLTDACNACHQAAKRGFVVIQEPKESMFPNQDFSAQP